MRPQFAASLLLFSLFAGVAHAQTAAVPKPASPEQVQKMMDASLASVMTNMTKMTETMMDIQLSIAARPETAERIAEFKKNLYDALLRKGFSQEQATAIVSATTLPSVGSATR